MAYTVYLGEIQFPIAPAKITTKVRGQNNTINLIDGNEVNILKPAGLAEISFDVLIPQQKYSFSNYGNKDNAFQNAKYFLDKLEALKLNRTVCQFTINRERPDGKLTESEKLFYTDVTVSLEDYTIKEDASEGLDIVISINLKQYVKYGTKAIVWKRRISSMSFKKAIAKLKQIEEIDKTGEYISINKILSKKEVKNLIKGVKVNEKFFHVVKKGDTLANIARKYYGSEELRQLVYEDNKAVIEKAAKTHKKKSSSNGHLLYPKTKLKLRVSKEMKRKLEEKRRKHQ